MTSFIFPSSLRPFPGMTLERCRRICALAVMLAVAMAGAPSGWRGAEAAGAAATAPFAWTLQSADAAEGAGLYTSLVLDEANHPFISYVNEVDGTFRIASQINGTWSSEVVAGPSSYLGDTNVLIAPNRTLEVSFYDAMTNAIMYGVKGPGGWELTRIDSGFSEGYNRLALNSAGQPGIAYSGMGGDLRYAAWNGTAWAVEVVDRQTIISRYEDLTFDALGRAQISYYGNGTLIHAWRNVDGWKREVVDTTSFAGEYSRIRVDSQGWAHIAYYASANTSLMYASQGLGGWSHSLVDASGDVGIDLSFTLDAAGRAQIAYYDRLAGILRYTIQTSQGWVREAVDRGGVTGWYTAIATDALGLPHISYYNWSASDLRYATAKIALQVRSLGFSKVNASVAVLRGELVALGNHTNATVGFDFRQAGSPNWTYKSVGELGAAQVFTITVTNLSTNRTYEFRAVASAGAEASSGSVLALRITLPPPPPLNLFVPILLAVAAVIGGIAVFLVWRWRRRPKEPEEHEPGYVAR